MSYIYPDDFKKLISPTYWFKKSQVYYAVLIALYENKDPEQ